MDKILNEAIDVIKGGVLYILSGNILVKAMAMISSIVIARMVDKNSYAYYAYANNLYQYIDMFAGLGLTSAILIICASNPDSGKTKGYWKAAAGYGELFQICAVIFLCIITTVVDIPFYQARKYIYALAFMPVCSYFLQLLQSYSRIRLDNIFYSFLGILQSVIICAAGILLTYFFCVEGMIAARYIGVICTIICGLSYYRRFVFRKEAVRLEKKEKKRFLKLGVSLMAANLFSSIMPLNEVFLINHIIQDETIIADFKVAGLFPEQLLIVTGALMIYYFPIIAKINNLQKTWNKIKKIAMINFIIISLITLIGVLIAPLVIRILYGEKYTDAVPFTYILWSMRAINAGIRMVPMNLLPAIGFTKFNACMAFFSCVIQTVLDYFLISSFGIQGVAYATISVYLVSGALTWIFLYYVCNRKSNIEGK